MLNHFVKVLTHSKNKQQKFSFIIVIENAMKINNNIAISSNYTLPQFQKKSPAQIANIETPYERVDYSRISFGAINGVKNKKPDIEAEKNKLLKKLNETLTTAPEDPSPEEILEKTLLWYKNKIQQQTIFNERLEKISNDYSMPQSMKMHELLILKREYDAFARQKPPFSQKTVKPKVDEKTDLQLVNKFKSAIIEDNFNLQKIYDEYYSGLNNIQTAKELKAKYPKIIIPQTPAHNISQKLVANFTKSFYEGLDDLIEKGDEEGVMNFLNQQLYPIIDNISDTFKIDKDFVYIKLAPIAFKTALDKYIDIKEKDGISALPLYRKSGKLPLTENDIKLLCVDYDDFVLSVVKQQYLENKKLNNIVYTMGNVVINAGTLKEPAFKFEKVSEKIKSFIKSANEIQTAQRNYPLYNTEDFKKRLDYYSNTEIGNDERIFEYIMNFDACNFVQEDIPPLIQFLKELDAIKDGDKTIDESIDFLQTEKISPKGTEKLNESEKQKLAEKLKQEQRKAVQLKQYKDKFDNAMNILYMNDMSSTANICSKYRPATLENDNSETDFIIDLINKTLDTPNNPAEIKDKLKNAIIRRDTYNHYKNNYPQSPIFVNAQKYAVKKDGYLNIDTAGKYILNAEIVESYPDCLNFVQYAEILPKIIEKTDKNSAIEYLCKISDYNDMSTVDKTFLSKILTIFNEKDSIDKSILKYIIENDYINTGTSVQTNIHGKENETITATFAAKAKQEIYDKYLYPLCLEYLEGFESALSAFSSEKGNSGIKLITRNNKSLEHKMELKLSGHDDRLFSSKNDYCFDIFSDKGLH